MITYTSRWTEVDRIFAASTHLRINTARVPDAARVLAAEAGAEAVSFTDDPVRYPAESPAANDDATLHFLLLLGALSFCIWRRRPEDNAVVAWSIDIDGERYLGARGLAAALMRALRRGQNLYDPAILQRLTLEDVTALFRDESSGATTLQMLPKRLEKLHELGRVLDAQYDGHLRHLLARAEGRFYRDDGLGAIQQLMTAFPVAFGDFPFAKLPQLTVKFLMGRRRPWIPTTSDFDRLTTFQDTALLDASADYYIPFFFLRFGLLEADDTLLGPLARRELLPPDSLLEQGYRAATLVLCRHLAEASGLSMADIDTLVWKQGYLRCRPCYPGATDADVPCPQRPNCLAFQQRLDLMQIGWPLVHTPWY